MPTAPKRSNAPRPCDWCREPYQISQLTEISGQLLCPACTSLYHGGDEDEENED